MTGDDSKHYGSGIQSLDDIRREREAHERIERRILESLYESDAPAVPRVQLRRALADVDDATFNAVMHTLLHGNAVSPGQERPPFIEKTLHADFRLTDAGHDAYVKILNSAP